MAQKIVINSMLGQKREKTGARYAPFQAGKIYLSWPEVYEKRNGKVAS
ncbi:MAG: hypothetical protein AAGB19_10060 [Cyanobacteria bacterium P01_F01_bin.3]